MLKSIPGAIELIMLPNWFWTSLLATIFATQPVNGLLVRLINAEGSNPWLRFNWSQAHFFSWAWLLAKTITSQRLQLALFNWFWSPWQSIFPASRSHSQRATLPISAIKFPELWKFDIPLFAEDPKRELPPPPVKLSRGFTPPKPLNKLWRFRRFPNEPKPPPPPLRSPVKLLKGELAPPPLCASCCVTTA